MYSAVPTAPTVSAAPEQSTNVLFDRLAAGDPDARERLLAHHLPLVRHLAGRMIRRLSVDVEVDDLVSAGTLGLIQAIEAFDPSRGFAFSSFAAPRVRGAMLDELRRNDHVSRSIRRKVRGIAAARRVVSQRVGGAPAERDVAEHLDVPVETLRRWRREAEAAKHTSIDAPVARAASDENGHAAATLHALAVPDEASADARLDADERRVVLRDAIMRLREQERVVLAMYYFEELTMKDIAPVLNVSESRVCQIHKKALRSLREAVAEHFDRAA
jgi:RNA polymerase sigma factor FliA